MREDGFSTERRLDFDFAVRGLKRWADQRAALTRQVAAPPAPSKPQATVPLYATLAEVLALPTEAETEMARHGLTRHDMETIGRDLLEEVGRQGDDEWHSEAPPQT